MYRNVFWKSDIVLDLELFKIYDLDEVSLCEDVERDSSKKELVGQNTDTPNVDLVTVVVSL